MRSLARPTAALARVLRRSRRASPAAPSARLSNVKPTAPRVSRAALSTLRHNLADERLGIGYLQLAPEEIEAEQDLVRLLPDFQQAMDVLHGDSDQYAPLPTAKKASLALPQLERTVEICRSAMGFNSVYLLAALRHLCVTQFAAGHYAAATRAMLERGEAMDWPMPEQERVLRLFLRQNQPARGLEWCQKDVFTALFPRDDTVPIKWTMYELIAKTLQHGPSELHVRDPMFARAVAVLRRKEAVVTDQHGAADATLLSHEVPHLLSQYAALSLAASGVLTAAHTKMSELTETQQASIQQAEELWREALAFIEQTAHGHQAKDELATGVDAPFEAWTLTNLGELLLRMDRTEEAMEVLGRALQTQQQQKGGNALALSRVLSKIAHGCHLSGQAVTSEGLFTSVLDAFEKEPHLSPTDQLEYALALRAYGALLKDWDKREKDAHLKLAKADEVERAVAAQCARDQCAAALHPVFYLPL